MEVSYADDDCSIPEHGSDFLLQTCSTNGWCGLRSTCTDDGWSRDDLRTDAGLQRRVKRRRHKQPQTIVPSSSSRDAKMNVKNPVMILNELQPAGLRYDHVVKSGTEHLPVYTVNVNVYGQTFSGVGRTKKEAKQLAAHTALESCIQFQHPSQIHTFQAAHQPRDQALTSASEDFTNDNDEVHRPPQCLERSSTYSFRCGAAECEPARSKLDCRSSSSVWAGMLKDRPPVTQSLDLELHRTRTMCRAWSNPVAVLNDLRPNVQYRRVDSDQVGIRKVGFDNGPDHRGRQRAVVALSAEVDGQEFLGCGRTQKFAKRQLASQVLRTLFKFQYIGQRSPQARYTSPG